MVDQAQQHTDHLLNRLRDVGEVEIAPIGTDWSLVKYFAVTDITSGGTLFILQSPSPDKPTLAKNQHGDFRFKISGAFKAGGQVESYFSSTEAIGCVKTGVIYDRKLQPIYKCNPEYVILERPSAYKISPIGESDNNEVAFIFAHEASMFAEFNIELSTFTKALLISLVFHYGLTKHRLLEPKLSNRIAESNYIFKHKSIQRPASRPEAEFLKHIRRQSAKREEIPTSQERKSSAYATELREQIRQASKELTEYRQEAAAERRRTSAFIRDQEEEEKKEESKSRAQSWREETGDNAGRMHREAKSESISGKIKRESALRGSDVEQPSIVLSSRQTTTAHTPYPSTSYSALNFGDQGDQQTKASTASEQPTRISN